MKSTLPSQSGNVFPTSTRCLIAYNSRSAELGSSRTRKLEKKSLKKNWGKKKKTFFWGAKSHQSRSSERLTSCVLITTQHCKGSVWDSEPGKKAKATLQSGGKSVSDKSQTTHTRRILRKTFFIRMYQSINLVLWVTSQVAAHHWMWMSTEWKPIPRIYPIRTTVRIGRG